MKFILVLLGLILASQAQAQSTANPVGSVPSSILIPGGGVPRDYTSNPMAVAATPYVNLVVTVPVNALRQNVEVSNDSGATCQVVLDDGVGTVGTITTFLLAGGSTIPSQGGAWGDTTFKGRVRVYCAATTAFIAARQF